MVSVVHDRADDRLDLRHTDDAVHTPMIHNHIDIEKGQLVFLYPHTKTASRNVHRLLMVRVVDEPAAHWPLVGVGWVEKGKTANDEVRELVHKDNIRLRPAGSATNKAEKAQGDSTGGLVVPNRVRVMPGRIDEIDPQDGIQEALF